MQPHSKQSRLRGTSRGQVKKQSVPVSNAVQHQGLPLELQQAILNIFIQAFPITQNHELEALMQEVKGHLFNRDFAAAFSKPEYLDVYALRWSAARALAYTDIFARSNRLAWLSPKDSSGPSLEACTLQGKSLLADHRVEKSTRIVCIGGGAGAEIAALASSSRYKTLPQALEILAVDIADWSEPVRKISESLTAVPTPSVLGHESANPSNHAFITPDKITVRFLNRDILSFSSSSDSRQTELQEEPVLHGPHAVSLHSIFTSVTLCTMMFTLNELFSTSISKTTAMLLSLTDAMEPDSWLVVVDSPGSYSEVKLGKTGETKKYPMKWLLDHTLLDMAGQEKWTKVEDEESVWFRIEDKHALRYPLELENMRYQIHVYRRRE